MPANLTVRARVRMTLIKLKNLPKLRLADLLRRRKMSLAQLLSGFGITTYPGLVNHCNRMGVLPPGENEFKAAFVGPPVNNPQEGVIVVEPMPAYFVDEITGKKIDPDGPIVPGVTVVTELSVAADDDTDVVTSLDLPGGPQKKPRRKKETTQVE